MKILHLYSDWKWTGPAEPVVNLCKELERRGHEVIFAYRKPPIKYDESIEIVVKERNIQTTDRFNLNRYLSIKDNLRDFFALPEYIGRRKFDILHVHLSHDHLLGGLSAKRASRKVKVIRTNHKAAPLKKSIGNRILIRNFTDGLIDFSEIARRENIKNFGIPRQRTEKVSVTVDCDRFNPRRKLADMRSFFKISEGDPVVGVVARFQRYRRMNIFLEAIARVIKDVPNLRALMVGRSSQMKDTVIKPIEALNLTKNVILAGYRMDDYVATLAIMDIFVFLVAGSDGTGRALREAIAMGKPAIVARRGMLPEMVEEGVAGLVIDDTPDNLAKAILKLVKDEKLRKNMGEAAYKKARRDFAIERQAEEVEMFYEKIRGL